MHFWIDKRSQACGFNGRQRIPASLSAGRRRRSKPMVTPVHRFQSIESGTVQQVRRLHQQAAHSRHTCLTQAANVGHGGSRQTAEELEGGVEGSLDIAQHAQLMRLGGRIKYGMYASFVLTTLSVAATKFYVDHQGSGVELLMLAGLAVLSLGLLVSCVLSVCKTKSAHLTMQQQHIQRPGIEIEIPEPAQNREEVMLEVGPPPQPITAAEPPPPPEPEQPPPPYHIAILLPAKDNIEAPPPSYERAVR